MMEDLISVTDPNINVIDENSINRSSYLSVSSMTTAKIIVVMHEQTGFLRPTLSSAVICLQLQDMPWVFKVNIFQVPTYVAICPSFFPLVFSRPFHDSRSGQGGGTVARRIFISTRHKTRAARKTGGTFAAAWSEFAPRAWAVNNIAVRIHILSLRAKSVPISCHFALTISAHSTTLRDAR